MCTIIGVLDQREIANWPVRHKIPLGILIFLVLTEIDEESNLLLKLTKK